MCFLGRIGLDLDFIEIHAVEFGRHTIVEIGFQWFEKHSQPVHFNKGFEHMCVCVIFSVFRILAQCTSNRTVTRNRVGPQNS